MMRWSFLQMFSRSPMHEYSLMRGLLSQVETLRRQHAADQVVSIRLVIGEFSGIEAELLQSAFEDLAQGTASAEAKLELVRTQLSARCSNCNRIFNVENFRFVCPHCKSQNVVIEQGEELLLDTVTFRNREMESHAS